MTVRHPPVPQLVKFGHEVANFLHNHGTAAELMADELAARGFPAGTGGEGSHSSSTSTSVERSLGIIEGDDERDDSGNLKPAAIALQQNRWVGKPEEIARLMRAWWVIGLKLQQVITEVVTHGASDDQLPAGTGDCIVCGTFHRPRAGHPHDRLRSGYCPACWQAWLRFLRNGGNDRAAFKVARLAQLDDDKAKSG